MEAGPTERLLELLNGRTQEGNVVRRWVQTWMSHDCDLARIPEIIDEVNSELAHYHMRLMPRGIHEVNQPAPLDLHLSGAKQLFTDDWPEQSLGRPVIVHFSTRGRLPTIARRFVDFVLSADAQDLQECRRAGCERYFLRTGKRVAYCTDACARHSSAVKAMRARRLREQNRRLAMARKVIAGFKNRSGDWKYEIASKVGSTEKWVTRQISRGTLQVPLRGSNRAVRSAKSTRRKQLV